MRKFDDMQELVRILSVFLMLSGSAGALSGQEFRGGIRAGLTASEVSGDDAGGPDKPGWFAAVFTNRDISEYSRLQLEVMYIQKGSRVFRDPQEDRDGQQTTPFFFAAGDNGVPDSPSEGYRDYRFTLHYVEVPLAFKFDFSPLIPLPYVDRLTGEIGLSGSTVVGHYEESEGKDITDRMADDRPFYVAELNLLAGLYYPIHEGLDFHFRFSQGVTPLRPHQSEVATQWYNRGQYNTVWSFGLSFTFLSS
ncbi:MAG: outer membrane beta-barrel protein [Bacteroidales bacterium]